MFVNGMPVDEKSPVRKAHRWGPVGSYSFVCDRSLDSERFRSAFDYTPPTWDKMIQELAQDNDFYK